MKHRLLLMIFFIIYLIINLAESSSSISGINHKEVRSSEKVSRQDILARRKGKKSKNGKGGTKPEKPGLYSKCYKKKEIGNKTYNLIATENILTLYYGCKDGCVYEEANEPGSKYCFEKGGLFYMFQDWRCSNETEIENLIPIPEQWNGVQLLGGKYAWLGNVYSTSNIPIRDCTWNANAANVVCRQLGLGEPREVYSGSRFGKAMLITNSSDYEHSWKLSVYCTGQEHSFSECKVTECERETLAGVQCGRVRLESKGLAFPFLEDEDHVYLDTHPVAADGFNDLEAQHICSHVGFANGSVGVSRSMQLKSANDFLKLRCHISLREYPRRLSLCTTIPCPECSTMATVICKGRMKLRLIGGDGESYGNVFFNNGPVCDDGWDINDANVVCNSLGFDGAERATTHSRFGNFNGQYQLNKVDCSGEETDLSDCQENEEGKRDCVLGQELAGVICKQDMTMAPAGGRRRQKRQGEGMIAEELLPQLLPALMGNMGGGGGGGGGMGGMGGMGSSQLISDGMAAAGDVANYLSELGAAPQLEDYNKPTQQYLNERPDMVNMGGDEVHIKLRPTKGFLSSSGEFQPDGYDMTMKTTGSKQSKTGNNGGGRSQGSEAYVYTSGLGHVLMNGCYASHYQKGDPCYSLKKTVDIDKCLDIMEAADFVGVGFDGTGSYNHAHRKKSLIQRRCAKKQYYHDQQVPDNMNVFGIYDTSCSGQSFESLGERSQYHRTQSDMGENSDLLSYHGTSQKTSVDGWATPVQASYKTTNSNKHTQSTKQRNSQGEAQLKQTKTSTRIYEFSCRIRRYNIFLDEVVPEQLSLAFLEDYMSLPISYFDYRNQAPQKYNNFLHRWGTHYIKSADFGGKFSLLRETSMRETESKQEFQERVSKDTSSLFEAKHSEEYAVKANTFFGAAKVSHEGSTDDTHTESHAVHTDNETEDINQNKNDISYSMDDIIVEGGSQRVAAILSDKYRFGFKGEFQEWLDSVPTYPKGFDFKFGDLSDLLDMDYRSLVEDESLACWKYDNTNDSGEHLVYNVTIKNATNDEVVETRKCHFKSVEDFQIKMDRKLASLKTATSLFIKNGGRSFRETSVPAGPPDCENIDSNAKSEVYYNHMIEYGEYHEVKFDLETDIGGKIKADDNFLVRFINEGTSDGKTRGRWEVKDFTITQKAGLYSRSMAIDTKKQILNILGVQLTLEGSKQGNFLVMTPDDCKKNKKGFNSPLGHLSCEEDDHIDWINVPLATVRAASSKEIKSYVPCSLSWSNSQMLMSDHSCVRFTATSSGPIYFAVSAIPNRVSSWYYVRISPDSVSMYKGTEIMPNKTHNYAALALGDEKLIQTYIVCTDYNKDDHSTRVIYGKLASDETMIASATYEAYLVNEDTPNPIQPSYFAFGSGESKVQISDIQMLELPSHMTPLYDVGIVKECSGSSTDWQCCSLLFPCKEAGGDCDTDSDCEGSLVCGNNNCKDFNPLAEATADCCKKPEKDPSCPPDWKLLSTGCYFFEAVSNGSSHQEAKAFCESKGGYLAEIESQVEQDTLWKFVQENGISGKSAWWLGATDQLEEGIWKWEHSGKTFSKTFSYSAFSSGEPNNANGNEDCLVADSELMEFTWNDYECDLKIWIDMILKPLCEYELTKAPQTESIEPGLKGWCLKSDGQNQYSGRISLDKKSKAECYHQCKELSGTTGCEWHISGNCICHTHEVSSGSGYDEHFCWVFNSPSTGLRCGGVDNGCCTSKTPCKEGDGDCDSDSQCEGELVCGFGNCEWGDGDDCCQTRESGFRCGGVDNGCCTAETPCKEGDGDCDSDSQCEGELVCGNRNCKWGDGDDCCRTGESGGGLGELSGFLGVFGRNAPDVGENSGHSERGPEGEGKGWRGEGDGGNWGRDPGGEEFWGSAHESHRWTRN